MKPTTIVACALLGSSLSFAVAAVPREGGPQQAQQMEQEESVQPVSDSWITTKVKTELMAARGVSGVEVKVETVNGQVKLSGEVDSQEQSDRAVAVARSVKGVKDVDASALTVKPGAAR
ncbi:BON domain-containing protein [Luteimonas aquatica]|uniref:BON domain-containing protein n=1 Tax=Luteimonas aquatica TaxID=450364 RepID=UPI001F585265|nr:BON domain-containing protein [Luteimonas aquatica]